MKSLRVAQVCSESSANGGVGTYLLRLCDALHNKGHQVGVVHSDRNAALVNPAIKHFFVREFDRFADSEVCHARAAEVIHTLESVQPDIVHIQSNNNFELEGEIRRRFPAVKSLHVYDFCPSGNKFHHLTQEACNHSTGQLCLARMGYKRCLLSKRPSVIWQHYRRAAASNENNSGYHKLIVGSKYVKEQSIASGYPASQVEVLPYFTSLPVLSPVNGVRDRTVLFVGRVVREKGLDRLLSTLAKVRTSWRLVVDGDGPDLPRIKSMASDLGMENRVKFVGWTSKEQHLQHYAQASVVVVPSVWPEPFGMVGIEAMSYGKPVVAFGVGGIPEWLEDQVTGFLVQPYDEEQMASRISSLLDCPAQAAAMGAEGRKRVKERFSEQEHIARLLRIYDEVIDGHFQRSHSSIRQSRLETAAR